jgi:hypothetical protein
MGHPVPRDLAWRKTMTFKLIIIAGVFLTVAACVVSPYGEGPAYYGGGGGGYYAGGYYSSNGYGGGYYASRGYDGNGQLGYYSGHEGHGSSGSWDRD